MAASPIVPCGARLDRGVQELLTSLLFTVGQALTHPVFKAQTYAFLITVFFALFPSLRKALAHAFTEAFLKLLLIFGRVRRRHRVVF